MVFITSLILLFKSSYINHCFFCNFNFGRLKTILIHQINYYVLVEQLYKVNNITIIKIFINIHYNHLKINVLNLKITYRIF